MRLTDESTVITVEAEKVSATGAGRLRQCVNTEFVWARVQMAAVSKAVRSKSFNWINLLWVLCSMFCNQSEHICCFLANQKQDKSQSRLGLHAFSHAWRQQLHVSASSSNWFTRIFALVVIDQSEYLELIDILRQLPKKTTLFNNAKQYLFNPFIPNTDQLPVSLYLFYDKFR